MATIKSYTDLPQSEKLAKILPRESADMVIDCTNPYYIHTELRHVQHFDSEHYPAWSLAALLGVLPIVYTNNKKEICGPLHIDITDSETPFVLWYVNPLHKGNIVELKTKECDNLVDACYEMIMRLHELKML